MRSMIAREGIAIALPSDSKLFCRIGRESRHDGEETARQKEEMPKLTP